MLSEHLLCDVIADPILGRRITTSNLMQIELLLQCNSAIFFERTLSLDCFTPLGASLLSSVPSGMIEVQLLTHLLLEERIFLFTV